MNTKFKDRRIANPYDEIREDQGPVSCQMARIRRPENAWLDDKDLVDAQDVLKEFEACSYLREYHQSIAIP
jgi:hypothetical protein